MIQNGIVAGTAQMVEGIIFQANVIGNPNDVALEPNQYQAGQNACVLIELDSLTGYQTRVWVQSGTLEAPAWTAQTTAQAATAVSGAVTVNGANASITTDSLTTAAGSTYALTVTNSAILAGSNVQAIATNGTSTAGTALVQSVVVTSGQAVITIANIAASAAFNGTLEVSVIVD